jgi:hypothetical protein
MSNDPRTMNKYKSPVQGSEASISGDQRDPSRRLFDSVFAKFLRVASVALGIYAPVAILVGVVFLFGANYAGEEDTDFARTNRRQIGMMAGGIALSGTVAGYLSYKTWGIASNVRRNNRRRAKGLD